MAQIHLYHPLQLVTDLPTPAPAPSRVDLVEAWWRVAWQWQIVAWRAASCGYDAMANAAQRQLDDAR